MEYDYTQAGFDGFLSRSIDNLPQPNLNAPGPVSNQVAYDRTQVTGALGDTLRIGRIYLNGSSGTIVLNDGSNDFLLMGSDE